MISAFARFAKNHIFWIKLILFFVCLIPVTRLALAYYTDQLGINKLDTLLHTTGQWTLYFLILTLTITPLRRFMSYSSIRYHARYGKRLSDWNWIIKLRRMLGLYAFFYCCLHLSIYILFDSALDTDYITEDIVERPFILMGFIGFLLLVPVAFTSTDNMIKRLGKNWRHVQRLTYIISIIALIHYWWLTKVGVYKPVWVTLILFFLLAYRLLAKYGVIFNRPADIGMEVPER